MSRDIIREDARLIVLRALEKEANESLHSGLLQDTLEYFGIARSREWVNDELDYLAEMGAVRLTEAGSVKVATLTEKGARHLKRQLIIAGVRRPSREA